jgi:hypothetical protein
LANISTTHLLVDRPRDCAPIVRAAVDRRRLRKLMAGQQPDQAFSRVINFARSVDPPSKTVPPASSITNRRVLSGRTATHPLAKADRS